MRCLVDLFFGLFAIKQTTSPTELAATWLGLNGSWTKNYVHLQDHLVSLAHAENPRLEAEGT